MGAWSDTTWWRALRGAATLVAACVAVLLPLAAAFQLTAPPPWPGTFDASWAHMSVAAIVVFAWLASTEWHPGSIRTTLALALVALLPLFSTVGQQAQADAACQDVASLGVSTSAALDLEAGTPTAPGTDRPTAPPPRRDLDAALESATGRCTDLALGSASNSRISPSELVELQLRVADLRAALATYRATSTATVEDDKQAEALDQAATSLRARVAAGGVGWVPWRESVETGAADTAEVVSRGGVVPDAWLGALLALLEIPETSRHHSATSHCPSRGPGKD